MYLVGSFLDAVRADFKQNRGQYVRVFACMYWSNICDYESFKPKCCMDGIYVSTVLCHGQDNLINPKLLWLISIQNLLSSIILA